MSRRGHGEGSIYQRKDGRWAATISLDGGKRKTFYGKTRKEVQEQLTKALHEKQQGTFIAGPRQTIRQFLTYWLEDVQKPAVRTRTYIRYESQLRLHILPVLGSKELSKLTPQHVQALYSQMLKKGLSPQSIRLLHSMLHKAFDYGVRIGLLSRNICDAVTPPKIERSEMHVLTLEQIQQFLQAARGNRIEALFVLASVTGMRRGELLGLKWRDINFTEGVLSVRRSLVELKGGTIESEPKSTSGNRSIVLPPFVQEVLKRHRVHQVKMRLETETWQDHDFVFCTSHGTPFAAANLRTMFKDLLKKAGLPDIRFHDLRHSVATMLLSLGTHPKVVQELLGHGSISITMDTYSHVMPTMQKNVMARLDGLLGGERQMESEDNGHVAGS